MKTRLAVIVTVFVLLSSTGCASLAKRAVGNLGGWDLSACVGIDESKVCRELFMDNQENILGGQTAVELVIASIERNTGGE